MTRQSWIIAGIPLLVANIAHAEPVDALRPANVQIPRMSTDTGDSSYDELVERLREAEEKLRAHQTGNETQELQKAVLAQLDELLKSPPQPPNPRNNSAGQGSSGENQDSSDTARNAQQMSGGSGGSTATPASAGPAEGTSDPATGRQGRRSPGQSDKDRDQSEDSEERTGERRRRDIRQLPRRRLEVDVWGHLPEKVREQMLNSYGERMVPQYESQVRKFYEALADSVDRDSK